MKHVIILILILSLLCPSVFSNAIAEGAMQRSSNYFISYGTSMGTTGNGGIAITFKAVGTGLCNQIGVATYQVQKLNDDGDWVFISGAFAGQTGTNVASYCFGRYFQGVAGETYRIQVTFLCTINNGTETKSYTSGRITAE